MSVAMFRVLLFAALSLATSRGFASDADLLTICHGYGCKYKVQFRLTQDQFTEVQTILVDARTPEEERRKIGKAVQKFFEYAADVAPVENDRGRNFPHDPDGPGKMDCIDHATSVSSFLQALGARGFLQFHRPMSQAYRSFLIVFAQHWSAQILDLRSQTAIVVDRWPYDYGREPLIIETAAWRRRLPADGQAYSAK